MMAIDQDGNQADFPLQPLTPEAQRRLQDLLVLGLKTASGDSLLGRQSKAVTVRNHEEFEQKFGSKEKKG